MIRGKNALTSSSLKYFFRSTACAAAMPCQITSTMKTSTSPLFAAQYCWNNWRVAEASLGRLIYSTLLPVFCAHSSAAARVQRPPSPTSESPANRTVAPAPKTVEVIKEATASEQNHRRAFRPLECFWKSIGGDLSRWE